MSYTALCKKWERESKRKDKLEKAERKRQQEQREKFQEAIYIAKSIAEKEERKQLEQKQKKISTIKDEIILALRENNPFTYKQYLIIWDIITNNYSQILSDIARNRIAKDEIIKAVQYIEQFSNEIIGTYWKDRLITE